MSAQYNESIEMLYKDWDTLDEMSSVLRRRSKSLEEVEKVNDFILSLKKEVVEKVKKQLNTRC